jgi:hypothetical protein
MTHLPPSPEDKLRILEESRRANTRSALSAVLDPALSGRFAATAKADFTVGRDPVVNYPTLPGGPWGGGPQVGVEPPLGYSVEDLEPTGELHELERAAATAAANSPLSQQVADLSTVVGNWTGQSSPTSAPQPPDVAQGTARPSSKPGSITRRFG